MWVGSNWGAERLAGIAAADRLLALRKNPATWILPASKTPKDNVAAVIGWSGLLFLALAAITGNVLGLGLLLRTFAAIGVGRAAPADSLRPVLVALLGSAIGTTQIEASQWWGAACVAACVAGAFWLDP